ncbi:hypothetical protein FACS189459_5780 [Bacilli bacterium]|nr:hypothetical protein FACS189459_5780 [Bacilli bacterium]
MANTVKTTKTTKQQNNSNSTYPISQRRACEILSLIGMILNLIGCAVVVLIGIFMLGNAA